MVLRSLEATGFRNLSPSVVRFQSGVNLLWGENGAGKSNLLEAVYFLFTTCSFRTQRNGELVARGGSARVVRGGAWDFDLSDARTARRFSQQPTAPGHLVGMRMARGLQRMG